MSVAPASCPTPEILEGVALGHGAAAEIAAHLATCESCSRAIDQIRENNRFLSRFAVDGVLPTPPPRPARISEIEIPGYQIVREIHRGGQGVVYQAVQLSTRRDVAIKVMKQGPFATIADRARFTREIETLGRIEHPNIVAVHDAGETAGFHYFVMNYIDGLQLDEAFAGDAYPQNADVGSLRADGSMSGSASGTGAGISAASRRLGSRNAAVLVTMTKVCDAVHAAHLRGVMHRDLKPSNIRMDANGEPHVLDFGLAKSTDATRDSAMTRTGQFVGSLPWASPEQVAGESAKIDLRTDVYSLGAILYQLLSGTPPFDVGSNLRDAFDNVLRREPVRPSSQVAGGRDRIDDELDTIVLKCLSKDRDRRYQGAGDLARDLRRYLAGEPIEAKRDSALYILRKNLRRYRRRVVAGGAMLVLLSAFGVVMALLYQRSVHLEQRAVQSAASLAELLASSNIEQGRMAGVLGNMQQAERLLWRELLTRRKPEERGGMQLNDPPGPPAAYWALFELYRHSPCLRTLTPIPWSPRSVAAAEEGSDVWTVGVDGVVQRLDEFGAQRGRSDVMLEPGLGMPFVTGNGRTLLAMGNAGTALLHRGSADPGAPFAPVATLGRQAVRLSADGDRFIMLRDGAAQVWGIDPYVQISRFAPPAAEWTSVALSADGRRLAARDLRDTLYLWDVDASRIDCEIRADVSRGPLRAYGDMIFSPDGLTLADIWGIPGRVWNLHVTPPTYIDLADRPRDNRSQCISPDGRLLAVGELGGALRILDAQTGQRHALYVAHVGQVTSVSFTADSLGVWTSGDGELRLWEVTPDAGARSAHVADEHFLSVAAPPGGGPLLAGGTRGALYAIDHANFAVAPIRFDNDSVVSAIAACADNGRVAVGTYGNAAYLWPSANLEAAPLRLAHPLRVSHLCFSRDGAQLATSCDDSVVRIWTAADGVLLRELHGATDRIPQIAFAPDGRQLAAACRDGKLASWSLDSGEFTIWDRATQSPRRTVCYSPDGRWLMAAGADRVLEIWDVAQRACVASLAGHNQEIYCLDVSPDGRFIVSGDAGGAVRLWDLPGRAALATLDGHAESVMCVQFSSDGRFVYSAAVDGSVREWNLDYYQRHIAGQVRAQLRALGIAPEDARGAAWRAWADGVMVRTGRD